MLTRSLAALGLALLPAADFAFGQDSPAPVQQAVTPATTVQAEFDAHRRMTVPVTIGGSGPYRFLVDTGAQATVVTDRIAEALGLAPTGRAMLVAMASRTLVDTVSLNALEFAGRRFPGLTAPLLRDRDLGADGIIGLDTLQDLRVVIDFRAAAITIVDARERRASGYEIVVRARRKFGQMIITDARVDGVRTAVIIDTGSWYSLANRALQRKLGARHSNTLTSTDVTGTTLSSDVALVGRLEIGKLGLGNLPVGFTDSPAFAALELAEKPALILGMANLRAFDRVAIDFPSRRILFDVPRGMMPGRLDTLFEEPARGG